MITLTFSKNRAKQETFVLKYTKPLSREDFRFINSDDDDITSATLNIAGQTVELGMEDTTVKVSNKVFSAIDFSCQLTSEQMDALSASNTAVVLFDGLEVDAEIEVNIED